MRNKICNRCKEEKPIAEFSRMGRTTAHRQRWRGTCKMCAVLNPATRWNSPTRTAYRKKKLAERRLWLTTLKRTLSCSQCGLSFKDVPWLCEFHHRDPKLKKLQVGESAFALRSMAVVLTELSKCDPICPNCHRTHHYKEYLAGVRYGSQDPSWEN